MRSCRIEASRVSSLGWREGRVGEETDVGDVCSDCIGVLASRDLGKSLSVRDVGGVAHFGTSGEGDCGRERGEAAKMSAPRGRREEERRERTLQSLDEPVLL